MTHFPRRRSHFLRKGVPFFAVLAATAAAIYIPQQIRFEFRHTDKKKLRYEDLVLLLLLLPINSPLTTPTFQKSDLEQEGIRYRKKSEAELVQASCWDCALNIEWNLPV